MEDPGQGQGKSGGLSSPGNFVSDLLKTSYELRKPGIGEMRHGTEGWQALETSFVASYLAHSFLSMLMAT